MSGEESAVLTSGVERVRMVCKAIEVVAMALLAVFVIVWLLFLGLMVFGIVDSASSVPPGSVCYAGLLGLDIALLLYLAMRVFRAAEKGHPFDRDQVFRLRAISVLLVLYAVIDAFLSVDFQSAVVIAGYQVGLMGGDMPSSSSSAIDVGALFIAIAIYCASFIFQYGSLLQEMSDDTV